MYCVGVFAVKLSSMRAQDRLHPDKKFTSKFVRESHTPRFGFVFGASFVLHA